MRSKFSFNILSKIILYFGVTLVLITALMKSVEFYGMPFTNFKGEFQGLTSQAFNRLGLVADLKKERLYFWIKERRDGIEVLANQSVIKDSILDLRKIISANTAKGNKGVELWKLMRGSQTYQKIYKLLMLVKSTYGVYDQIEIMDKKTGVVLATTYYPHLGAKIRGEEVFNSIVNPGASYVSLQKDPHDKEGEFALIVAHAIDTFESVVKGDDEVMAIIVAFVNIKEFIMPLLHAGGGLGKTGEALLVNQDLSLLSPLKYPFRDGTIAVPLVNKIITQPAVLAARGEEGIVVSEDYRGVPVLAAFRHISFSPEMNGGMVVKKDLSEVLALVRYSRKYTFSVGVVSVLLVVILVSMIINRVMRPIKEMTEIAQKVEGGDFSVRVSKVTSDELGVLARAFNLMIERIQNWKQELEGKVKSRTNALEGLKDKLEVEVAERTKELREKVSYLERYHAATTDRELRMKELRNKIIKLEAKLREK